MVIFPGFLRKKPGKGYISPAWAISWPALCNLPYLKAFPGIFQAALDRTWFRPELLTGQLVPALLFLQGYLPPA